jgi:ribose transport system permease protein
MKKTLAADMIKRFFMTILFPLVVYIVMYILARRNGVSYFGLTKDMWRSVLVNTSSTAIAALAIWLQVKNKRFDFSGGAVMVLTSIVAGNLCINNGWGAVPYLILCMAVGALLCFITSMMYILGRLPIMICTIGMALLYESVTYLIFDASGLSMMSQSQMTLFGRMPGILYVLAIAVIVFIIYSYGTVAGGRAKLLANNQQAAVNIGVKENKNVIQTFLVCGVLLGCASAIYGSNNTISPQSGLSTAATLFANIIPAYMGMFVGAFSVDAIGVVMAAMGMEILNYGLNCIGYGAGGWQQIIVGSFMLVFYAFTAQIPRVKEAIAKKKRLAAN